MKRFVSYLYSIYNNQKIHNAGFARMELRTGRNRVDIHLKENGYSGKTGTVYLFIRRQENIQGISIGNITFRNNQADFRYEQAEENIGQTPWRIMQMHGILIMIDERAAFLSQWDEQSVDTAHFEVWEAKAGKEQADEATQKQETKAAPAEKVVSGEKAVPASDAQPERKPADAPAKQNGTESVGTEKAPAPSTQVKRQNMTPAIAQAEQRAVSQAAEQARKRTANPVSEHIGKKMTNLMQGQTRKRASNPLHNQPEKRTMRLMPDKRTVNASNGQIGKKTENAWNEQAGKGTAKALSGQTSKRVSNMTTGQTGKEAAYTSKEAKNVPIEKLGKEYKNASGGQTDKTATNIDIEQAVSRTAGEAEKQAENRLISAAEHMENQKQAEAEQKDIHTAELQPQMQNQWEQTWRYMLRAYPVMNQFADKNRVLCVRIEIKDVRLLPDKYWSMVNNSFLLHGFFNYRYLVFGRLDQSWFIGIPGIYQKQEHVMASIFGFPDFLPQKQKTEHGEQSGYWYRILEI